MQQTELIQFYNIYLSKQRVKSKIHDAKMHKTQAAKIKDTQRKREEKAR